MTPTRRPPIRAILACVALLGLVSGPGCRRSASPGTLDETLRKGDDALLAGRVEEAASAFLEATRMPDASGRAWSGLGLAQLRSGRVAEAISSFDQALKLDPGNVDYAFLRAHALQTGGRQDEAMAAYQRIEAEHPGRPEVEIQLIGLLESSDRLTEARHLALEAADRSPHDFDLVMAAGRLLQQSNEDESAIAYYHRARSIRPYSLEALYGMIEASKKAGQVQQSLDLIDAYHELEARTRTVDSMRQAAAAAPGDPEPARRYVDRLYDEGWLDIAVRETGTFLAQFPDDPARKSLALRAATAAIDVRDPATAARFYAIAKDPPPEDDADLRALARIASALGEGGDAAAYWQTCVDRHPDDREALSALGKALMQANEFERAEPPLRHMVALYPDDAAGRADLGLLLAKRGEEQAAEAEFNRALGIDSAQPDALFGLGLLAQQKKDFVTAEKYLRKALESAPGDQSALVVLALVLSDQRKCEEAVPMFTRALETDYRNMTVHAGLVRCLEQLGRMDEADKARRVAEEILGQSPEP